MRFRIKDEKIEDEVEIWLERDGEGEIDVIMKNSKTKKVYIVGFTRDGKLLRYEGIDDDLGLKLDEK